MVCPEHTPEAGGDQQEGNHLCGGHGHRRAEGAHDAGQDQGEAQRDRRPEAWTRATRAVLLWARRTPR